MRLNALGTWIIRQAPQLEVTPGTDRCVPVEVCRMRGDDDAPTDPSFGSSRGASRIGISLSEKSRVS
jgi:hypothetical protein